MLAFLMILNKWIFAHFLGFEAPDRWDPGNPLYGEPVWNTLFGMEIFSFTVRTWHDVNIFRACLFGGGVPQLGEVTRGGSPT